MFLYKMIKDIKNGNSSIKTTDKVVEKLHNNFPQCFNKEGKFDLEKFKTLIADKVDVTSEGYDLNFLGKNYANLIASTETETVIQPDIEHNNKPENINSKNIYITGDNLDALKHLLKSYTSKKTIKCIYIDPPYNTGSDGFVYNDKFNFSVVDLMTKLGVDSEKAKRILDLAKRGSASHSAWLMFMAPRLMLARDLLAEDGVIFISIDDNEQANLKLLCDSVFGEENFVALFPWRKRTAKSDVPFGISQDYEWIVCYAKSDLFMAAVEGGNRKYYETDDFPNRPWRIHDMTCQRTAGERPNSNFTMINPKNGDKFPADKNRVWRITKDTFQKYYDANEIIFPGDYDFLHISKPVARYFKDMDMEKAGDLFGKVAVSTKLPDCVGMSQDGTKDIDSLFSTKTFSYPKPVSLLKQLITASSSETDTILDFFSGSATTAHAILKLNAESKGESNRKFILVQLPEQTPKDSEARKAGYFTIDEIGQERIHRAAQKIREANPDYKGDLGFKHYTLRDVKQDTLDKMVSYSPQCLYSDSDILKEFGEETILETWCVKDGYGFGANVEEIKLGEYTAYRCGSHIYFIEGENFTENVVVALIDKYGRKPDFNPQNIVLFGYSFTYTQTEMLRKNLSVLRDSTKNLNINIDIRY